ncbi:hypothetical protein CALCODRAFT_492069 [Calocera cornea HHB12733]|uniref:CCD97-like C-terminal domain-containing protein n=1 Tax=Calocera cornea HHB12733 TaxID=1353952 RepID=A0A165INJ0_9BASI|nr:hypothetical protein CALCODRAFT_492069 [Calocera cornea HHB12733]
MSSPSSSSSSPSPPSPPQHPFSPSPILAYLSLPPAYTPSPATQPLPFLRQHLPHLPPSHAAPFERLLTPEQRAQLPLIRNRRLAYALHPPLPAQLAWPHAAAREPALWSALGGPAAGLSLPKPGEREAAEERAWAKQEFVGRKGPEGAGMVGDLGALLGGYEMERAGEAERERRRARALARAQQPEPEQEEEEEEEEMGSLSSHETSSEDEGASTSAEGVKRAFERAVRERFVAGRLGWADYACDWEDGWDAELEREGEERWFDAGEEGEGEDDPMGGDDTGVLDY